MVVEGRGCCKMPCESCAVQFSMFKRKRACSECERFYCSSCLRRGGGAMCAPCRVLSTRPLTKQAISHLKVRDVQCFLQRQNVSTRGCVEKEELLNLCVSHVNSTAYRRRGSRTGSSPFSSLKGFTSNINDFINSAFDMRNNPQPPQPAARGCASNCFNSAHVHNNISGEVPSNRQRPQGERFTTTPGGEPDICVPVPESSVSRSVSAESARVDTADCFEIEDLDDTGWEFVNRPADPLPNDSEVLLSTSASFQRRASAGEREADRPPEHATERRTERGTERPAGRAAERSTEREEREEREERVVERAASELELRSPAARSHDSVSLHDAPLLDREEHSDHGTPKHISLEQFKRPSDLDVLNVKQLKELLVRNRVEYRGCLERKDLLERAKTLWRNHAQYCDDVDNLPAEECCKICMAAPLECVLLECGHIAACTACAKQLAECPICRQYVVRAVRFFRS
ncbi:E3 ubiquitin-protein ligase rififylin [Spodoptera litura]|uniref:E3 ubiquitin-protein ligase rififylin n=1 Tax=Spodoptera litura TaxID=69820 RepID=A0A9J7E170_SPOLT|nr:E3 ubiquitin-protein ligase rififylin [Spodoptera litura]